jgi:hypothetical protein
MGRKRLYNTPEEIRIAINKRRMRYYFRHQRLERKRALARYYRIKNIGDLQNNQ